MALYNGMVWNEYTEDPVLINADGVVTSVTGGNGWVIYQSINNTSVTYSAGEFYLCLNAEANPTYPRWQAAQSNVYACFKTPQKGIITSYTTTQWWDDNTSGRMCNHWIITGYSTEEDCLNLANGVVLSDETWSVISKGTTKTVEIAEPQAFQYYSIQMVSRAAGDSNYTSLGQTKFNMKLPSGKYVPRVIQDIYLGAQKISAVYKGSQLVYSADPYKPGVVVLEQAEAGTYTFELKTKRKLQVIMVGAGGGGARTSYAATFTNASPGGSGAMLQGTYEAEPGVYTIVVGKGGTGQTVNKALYETGADANGTAGTATTGFGLSAGGGGGAHSNSGWGSSTGTPGAGGTATAEAKWTATQGKAGDSTGVYQNGYGAGAAATNPATNGKDGYVLIKSV